MLGKQYISIHFMIFITSEKQHMEEIWPCLFAFRKLYLINLQLKYTVYLFLFRVENHGLNKVC